jgi:hypothetical protein
MAAGLVLETLKAPVVQVVQAAVETLLERVEPLIKETPAAQQDTVSMAVMVKAIPIMLAAAVVARAQLELRQLAQ